MNNYSENEKEFFKKLLFDFDLRVDGRDKLSLRSYEVLNNIIPSCLSSIKLKFNDGQKEILFAVKGEILSKSQPTIESAISQEKPKLINISVDSMYKIEDTKMKKEIENYIESFILAKINIEDLRLNKNSDEYFWKIYIDVYIFDYLSMALLQMLTIGVKNVLKNLKLPNLVLFKNEITGNIEFDIAELYQDITMKEKELEINLEIPDMFIFAILNNAIYLDPTDEEYSVANSIVIVSCINGRISNIQSIGNSVEIQKMLDISTLIKSLSI